MGFNGNKNTLIVHYFNIHEYKQFSIQLFSPGYQYTHYDKVMKKVEGKESTELLIINAFRTIQKLFQCDNVSGCNQIIDSFVECNNLRKCDSFLMEKSQLLLFPY